MNSEQIDILVPTLCWASLITRHIILLHEHHDFFLALTLRQTSSQIRCNRLTLNAGLRDKLPIILPT